MDLRGTGITGRAAEEALDEVGITVNKNTVPFDPEKPIGHQRSQDRHAGCYHSGHERT